MIIDVKSPRGMNPNLENLAHYNGRLLAKKKTKEQNKHNTLMFVPVMKN
jgi:hypothetical protein